MRQLIATIQKHTHLRSVAGMAALADGVSTKFALSLGLANEFNVLAPSSITGIMIATTLKLAFTQYADKLLAPRMAIYAWLLCIAVWGSAATSNVFVMLGAPPISNILGCTGVLLIMLHFITKNSHQNEVPIKKPTLGPAVVEPPSADQ